MHALQSLIGCLLLHVFLAVSEQELLVIFHVKILQMLNSCGSVVGWNINSTPQTLTLHNLQVAVLFFIVLRIKYFHTKSELANC